MQLKYILHCMIHLHICWDPHYSFGSKVMADCHVTHCTSPNFLLGFNNAIYFCVHYKKDVSIDQLVPIVGVVAINNLCMCNKPCFHCCNLLLLARNAHGFGGLLHLPNMVQYELAACFFCCDGKTHFKF